MRGQPDYSSRRDLLPLCEASGVNRNRWQQCVQQWSIRKATSTSCPETDRWPAFVSNTTAEHAFLSPCPFLLLPSMWLWFGHSLARVDVCLTLR
ncbi:hypothetical protein PoB_005489200 [Plakobranchus ocellatus]|uniref:Uncharacterized protein n=1 Tax=Plakobranchus ocellatus TaxID=259542 RepID=A0AAV4CAI9_9GAST|nr:hypothetical protein PoB_005489200 [Plakobranchus ocellatus]